MGLSDRPEYQCVTPQISPSDRRIGNAWLTQSVFLGDDFGLDGFRPSLSRMAEIAGVGFAFGPRLAR